MTEKNQIKRMRENKRTRPDTTDVDDRPAKRRQPSVIRSNIKLSVLQPVDNQLPVLLNTNGIILPPSAKFTAYTKPKGGQATSEVFVHSDAHPHIDYHASCVQSSPADCNLRHYVGVFDPQHNELAVVEVHYMDLKTSLRSERISEAQSTRPLEDVLLSQRQKLGMEFGTKKAKKAIEDMARNAISPNKSKVIPSTAGGMVESDPAAAALLESMAATAKNAPTKDMLQAAVDAARPAPLHNLNASNPADVYAVEEIVGNDALSRIRVKPWTDAVESGGEVQTESRFVSKRLAELVKAKDVQKLKVLKFMLLLIVLYNAIGGSKKGKKILPKREALQKKMQVDDSLIDIITKRFATVTPVTSWHVDNLITHVAALSLIVDNFRSDIFDLAEDLNLKTSRMTKYFTEIGARTTAFTESEQTKAGLSKEAAAMHRVARLTIPLHFPQQRTTGSKRRR